MCINCVELPVSRSALSVTANNMSCFQTTSLTREHEIGLSQGWANYGPRGHFVRRAGQPPATRI